MKDDFNIMNFLIVRMENYKMGQAIKVDIEKDHNDRYDNPDCDKERTSENVTLEHDSDKDGKTLPQYIKDYREEHEIGGRMTTSGNEKSQTNVMTQCIITTSPEFMQSLSKDEQIDFFKDGLKAFKEMYPSYHVIDAVIHFDEKNPHMHINSLPLYRNIEKGITQFSTTETQKGKFHYRELQDRMYESMSKKWNVSRGISREVRKHFDKKEYKEIRDQQKELYEREKALKSEKKEFEKEKSKYESPTMKKTILGSKYSKEDVEKVVNERNSAYAELDRLKNQNRDLQQEVFRERENAISWEKTGREEHEKRLEEQDRADRFEEMLRSKNPQKEYREYQQEHGREQAPEHDAPATPTINGR